MLLKLQAASRPGLQMTLVHCTRQLLRRSVSLHAGNSIVDEGQSQRC